MKVLEARLQWIILLSERMNLKRDLYFFDSVYLLTSLQLGFQYRALWTGLKA